MTQRPKHGFTVVELLIAIVMFTVIIVAVLGALPNLYRVNRSTSDKQVQSAYAKNVMEAVRSSWLTSTTPIAPSTDQYPNFTAGTLPTLPAAPSSLSCQTPAVTAVGTATPIGRRRVTLTCTTVSGGNVTSFVVEFGRPQ